MMKLLKRKEELLEAAHIIPDVEPDGEPIVKNGISLCKFHHAAFDRLLQGVRPDYVIEVREDIPSRTNMNINLSCSKYW